MDTYIVVFGIVRPTEFPTSGGISDDVVRCELEKSDIRGIMERTIMLFCEYFEAHCPHSAPGLG